MAVWDDHDYGINDGSADFSLLGTVDLSYRFGGKTRRTEVRIKKGWEDNRRDIKQGGDVEESPEG